MSKGFTLIELSIVLVIIGLLAGGIVLGRSLVEAVAVGATVSQIQQFDAAVMLFKSRYRYLPGDAPAFGGNGDGRLNSTDPHAVVSTFGNDSYEYEVANWWPNLFPEKYAAANFYALSPVPNVPVSRLGKSSSFFIVSDRSAYEHYYIVTPYRDGVGFYKTSPATASLQPQQLLALDAKLDDSLANGGSVQSGYLHACPEPKGTCRHIASGLLGSVNTPTATCSIGSEYRISNSGYECTPLIRVGAQAGHPL